jgi:hypothetical protein
MLRCVVRQKLTDVSEALTVSILKVTALKIEAVGTSEPLATFYETTRRNIPEDGHSQRLCLFVCITPQFSSAMLGIAERTRREKQ